MFNFIKFFAALSKEDMATAGGKGANLGEMFGVGIPVPPGFVVLAEAYTGYLRETGLDVDLDRLLQAMDVNDIQQLEERAGQARELIEKTPMGEEAVATIKEAYASLGGGFVAVRSSATIEDSADASFAGINETFLNVHGSEDVVDKVRACWASLFAARSLFYRVTKGYSASDVPIAVVVQRMIPSEKAGVMFSIDPVTGDAATVVIEAGFGLGEAVVSGQVSPDNYRVGKSTGQVLEKRIANKRMMIERLENGGVEHVDLTNSPLRTAQVLPEADIQTLAELGTKIERHYGCPQDIEWAYAENAFYITQARPVTFLAKGPATVTHGMAAKKVLVTGLGASPGLVSGTARIIQAIGEASRLEKGDILVTAMTAPDWVPLMRRAGAIVTDEGGMTSHAAIVSRELGIPAIVGTGEATRVLTDGQEITVDASHGVVYAGGAAVAEKGPTVSPMVVASRGPVTATKIYVNLSQLERVEEVSKEAVDGVGLLRAEFILMEALDGNHPRLLLEEGREQEFVDRLTEKLLPFAESFHPRPVIYRASDFKSNEYRHLKGGDKYEPVEQNPMIGYRGAFRYAKEPELFELELLALQRVRREHRLGNLHLMLPFVRTTWDVENAIRVIDKVGLRADREFKLWVMAEVPSIIFRLRDYAALGVQGVSIGSNDLTQLILGLDRDGELVAELFDERDPAVIKAIQMIIEEGSSLGLTVSICGQGPSVYPELTEKLVEAGITSISVNPDMIGATRELVAAVEQRILLKGIRALQRAGKL